MGHIYLTSMADWFEDAGLKVVRYAGWETRARSSGGYNEMPLAVFFHHTASDGPVSDDANYECHVADAKPIANVTLERDGTVWCLAAGATNTNGSGKAQTFSRGTVPADGANARVFGMEISNMGTGAEPYPAAQIDAAFVVSNVINARSGNRPDDVCTHQVYAPDRKVDPATAAAVQGSFDPRSTTSSGTWSLPDLKAECNRRAGSGPPPDPGDDDMTPDQNAKLLEVWYWMQQLTEETDWPSHPNFRRSVANVVDERIAESRKITDVWYWLQQLTEERGWPNHPDFRQSVADVIDERLDAHEEGR